MREDVTDESLNCSRGRFSSLRDVSQDSFYKLKEIKYLSAQTFHKKIENRTTFFVNILNNINIFMIYSHVCKHSTIVVASMKYPLHILHVINGFKGFSFIFRSIIIIIQWVSKCFSASFILHLNIFASSISASNQKNLFSPLTISAAENCA